MRAEAKREILQREIHHNANKTKATKPFVQEKHAVNTPEHGNFPNQQGKHRH